MAAVREKFPERAGKECSPSKMMPIGSDFDRAFSGRSLGEFGAVQV
jgi:hypothetical protein